MGPKVPFSGAVKYIYDIHIRPNIQSICTVEDGAMIDEDNAYESRFVDGESSGSNQFGSGSGGGELEGIEALHLQLSRPTVPRPGNADVFTVKFLK